VTHDERRRAVTKALSAGTVPRDKPAKIWAGTGTDKRCAICGVTMRTADVEYEIEFASGKSVMLDRECHALWDQHRMRLEPVD
jgi:hypothetical protein